MDQASKNHVTAGASNGIKQKNFHVVLNNQYREAMSRGKEVIHNCLDKIGQQL